MFGVDQDGNLIRPFDLVVWLPDEADCVYQLVQIANPIYNEDGGRTCWIRSLTGRVERQTQTWRVRKVGVVAAQQG